MFFVHPQIKLKKENIKSIFLSFFRLPDLDILEKKLSFYFPGKKIIFTDMGRSAFKAIIEKLNLKNSQILLPAYICDIFYPILKQYNIQPIFLDIDLKTFNIKLEEIEKKITSKSRAILICHTYGLPNDIEKIKSILKGKVFIIEDCAHSFGAFYPFSKDSRENIKYSKIYTGNLGDVAFFSIYKQFPTFRGGFLVCPKDWQISLPKTDFGFRDFISLLNSFPLFAFLFKMLAKDVAPKMIRKEKKLEPAGINSASLNLFSYFLENFEDYLKKRIDLALFFQEELKKLGFEVQESENNVFCYLSALVPKSLGATISLEDIAQKRDEIVKKLRKYKIFCTRIWRQPIILNPEAQKEYQIKLEELPNTIEVAKRVINFPLQNYYEKKDIEVMIEGIKSVLS